ncbi:substrate-binding periplasmic protein [Thalassotalea euphylliae]|uniref:substrate-binding periplasmic protein n=1 Tax=Thalassotalea euphylliae TaxID=1655234 RepID=UPI0036348FB4
MSTTLYAFESAASDNKQSESATLTTDNVIRMIPPQSDADASHSYLLDLLTLALSATEQEYGKTRIELLPTSYNQRIILSLLNHNGILDVVTSAPTTEREEKFRSARVPLMRGLLGYRMMLIKPEDEEKFRNIKSEEELKKLRSCQASHWPDADIMEQAGYGVVRNPDYSQLFFMLLDGDCDYFPRGVAEGYAEAVNHNKTYPEQPLLAFDDILVHYPLPLYFYTSHKNFELAARLERGLEKSIADGSFDALLARSEVTKVLFPLSKWRNKTIYRLPNPLLPKSVPLEKKHLWIDLANQ